jgi:hypothetical protein
MKSPTSSAALALITALAVVLTSCGGGGEVGGREGDPALGQAATQQLADTFAATLVAEPDVPAANAAHAAGTVVIDPTSRHMLAVVATSGVNAASALIRETIPGAPQAAGPIMAALVETPPGSGVWVVTAGLSDAQMNALRAGAWYFALQSTLFPASELRGRLMPQLGGTLAAVPQTSGTGASAFGVPAPGLGALSRAPATFVATLRGAAVVPPTSSTAVGAGTVSVNPSTRQVAAAILVTGTAPTSAAIHTGPHGFNGPIALNLSATQAASGVWLARTTLSEEQFADLGRGDLYFTVRSAAFPDGEVRGQILPQHGVVGLVPSTPGIPETGFDSGRVPGVAPGVPGLPAIPGLPVDPVVPMVPAGPGVPGVPGVPMEPPVPLAPAFPGVAPSFPGIGPGIAPTTPLFPGSGFGSESGTFGFTTDFGTTGIGTGTTGTITGFGGGFGAPDPLMSTPMLPGAAPLVPGVAPDPFLVGNP